MDNLSNLESAELCERAARILQDQGMCRGTMATIDGRVCMVGAARIAQGRPPYESSTFQDKVLGKILGADNNDIYQITILNDFKFTEQEAHDYLIERSKFWRNQ